MKLVVRPPGTVVMVKQNRVVARKDKNYDPVDS